MNAFNKLNPKEHDQIVSLLTDLSAAEKTVYQIMRFGYEKESKVKGVTNRELLNSILDNIRNKIDPVQVVNVPDGPVFLNSDVEESFRRSFNWVKPEWGIK